jgi:hypothetical protein
MAAGDRRLRAVARYLRKLVGPRRNATSFEPPGLDDVAPVRCFREAKLGRPPAGDCLEFFAPEGTLIWEQRPNADG